MTKQNMGIAKTTNDSVYNNNSSNNVNDSDEDENIIGPPKLSNFGSALLIDQNHSSTFTKFQDCRNNKHSQLLNNEYRVQHTMPELDELINQETPSPSSSSSIFANTINQTSIRPTSVTTIHNTSNNNGNSNNHITNNINNSYSKIFYDTEMIQKLKQTMTKDELLLSEKILERRNNRRLSRTSSNHSTLNFNTSHTKELELSGNISSNISNNNNNLIVATNSNDNFQRLKALQQSLKEEVTSKYMERRSKRFLNVKRMSRLGPAKRASELVGIENEYMLMDSDSKAKEVITSISDYTTKGDNNNNNDNNNNVDIDGKLDSKHVIDDSKFTNDYSNIDFGDLNPLQYLKKHNIPTTELPQIAKIYFQTQKRGNRATAIRKRSLTPVTSQKLLEEGNGKNILRSRMDISNSNDKENDIKNNNKLQIEKQGINIQHRNYDTDKLSKKREALSSININKKEPDFKRMKSDPDELKSMVDEEKNVKNPVHKPMKKVEIQEPTASKRYHLQNSLRDDNINSGNYVGHNGRNPIILVNDTEYEKVELLGRGGSSKVYKVKGPSNKIYALKRVAFDEFDESSINGFKGEISLLEKLRNKDRVVQLFDYEMNSGVLYLIMECGDYDLSYVLNQKLKSPLDIEFIRYYAREMVKCVKVVHDADIVHSDLKPANFVFVKGILKIIDFGIANAVPDHTVNIYRETQIGTPNYMAPEALVAMNYTNDSSGQTGNRWKVGKPSDVWSIGCIIYQMVYGKPPYAGFQGQNRLLAIMNPEVKIMYPDKTSKDKVIPRSVIEVIKDSLHRDPNKRLTIDEMLQTGFFNPIMVSESFIRNLIKNAVYFGCEQNEVSDIQIDDLASDVINRLSEFRI
ncbi:hypothetical protein RI543_002011 [Arxiozyma heterogenica]|uniref:Protein kinase domain-containing protein n=2 Tax=Arxiozyma heterogenica TaxID=278026 RepID=A0AAN7ZSU7_9SACH|nr:hypothetical protein RI543_002011 [Kazachstania heterogenica]